MNKKWQMPEGSAIFFSYVLDSDQLFADCLRRSAQRFFMASAIRFRPSGEMLRLDFAVLFLLPLGRPGPAFAMGTPASKARACCNLDI